MACHIQVKSSRFLKMFLWNRPSFQPLYTQMYLLISFGAINLHKCATISSMTQSCSSFRCPKVINSYCCPQNSGPGRSRAPRHGRGHQLGRSVQSHARTIPGHGWQGCASGQAPIPHGGLGPFQQKSIRLTQLTLGPCVVQIWSRYSELPGGRNPRTPP